MKKYIVVFVLIMLVGWAVYSNVNQDKVTEGSNPEIEAKVGINRGNIAPDFTLTTVDGEKVKLSDFRGKKVILNFWATWCPPCREEIPDMVRFYNDYKNQGIVLLGVNLTTEEYTPDKLPQFIRDYNISYPVLMDKTGEVAGRYRVTAIPTSYIIDSNGTIRDIFTGPLTYRAMEKNIP